MRSDIPAPDLSALKSGGIIKQRQRDLFTVRLKCPGGRLPLDRLERILRVARRYGRDLVHLTVRQSIEIPHVHIADVPDLQRDLAEVGQEIASCGPRVRVPTACGGCEYNPNGLTDTQKMAADVCDRFFGKRPLAHKFKVTFAGCPSDCVRSASADLGFQGAVRPTWNEAACMGCRICADACTEGAITSDPLTGKPLLSRASCLYCGDCIRSCPMDAWRADSTGWMVRVGGKHGRHPIMGSRIAEFVPDELVPSIIESVLAWYHDRARGRGRIRIGTLLLQDGAWGDFLAHTRPVLADWAVSNPPPPVPCEIHFP